jgi:hypothetical protein
MAAEAMGAMPVSSRLRRSCPDSMRASSGGNEMRHAGANGGERRLEIVSETVEQGGFELFIAAGDFGGGGAVEGANAFVVDSEKARHRILDGGTDAPAVQSEAADNMGAEADGNVGDVAVAEALAGVGDADQIGLRDTGIVERAVNLVGGGVVKGDVPEMQNLAGLGDGDADGIARFVHQHGAAEFVEPADFISSGDGFFGAALGLGGKLAGDDRGDEKHE